MNAPNPSSDRDLEALRRAQRAHEPSMEEILASIRSIIADDREPPATSAPAPAPAAKPAAPKPAPVASNAPVYFPGAAVIDCVVFTPG